MGKRSALQLAIDKIDAQIARLQEARGILIEAAPVKKAPAKPRKLRKVDVPALSENVN